MTFSCSAPYGGGGLGRHLSELIEAARAEGHSVRYLCRAVKPGDEAIGTRVDDRMLHWLLRTVYRFNQQAKVFADCERFDRMTANLLTHSMETFVGFSGQTLRTFARARSLGAKRCIVVAGCCHVDSVRRRHQLAAKKYPIEMPWLGDAYIRKAKQEYESADTIYVSSEYARQTFLAENVPAEKLHRIYFQPAPRFKPSAGKNSNGGFRIVYTGAVSVAKGIPVLIDAFRRFDRREAELILVGNSSTRGMRRYLEAQIAADSRIRIAPGDPLPHLQRADLYVHPSFDDAFGYAPMEAMRCGLPVIVTEDTGMKEHVREGSDGFIVPTGDPDAILERILQVASRKNGV